VKPCHRMSLWDVAEVAKIAETKAATRFGADVAGRPGRIDNQGVVGSSPTGPTSLRPCPNRAGAAARHAGPAHRRPRQGRTLRAATVAKAGIQRTSPSDHTPIAARANTPAHAAIGRIGRTLFHPSGRRVRCVLRSVHIPTGRVSDAHTAAATTTEECRARPPSSSQTPKAACMLQQQG